MYKINHILTYVYTSTRYHADYRRATHVSIVPLGTRAPPSRAPSPPLRLPILRHAPIEKISSWSDRPVKDGPMASWPSVELGPEAPFSSPGAPSGSAVAAVSTNIWAAAGRSSHRRWPRHLCGLAFRVARPCGARRWRAELDQTDNDAKTLNGPKLLWKGPLWAASVTSSRALLDS